MAAPAIRVEQLGKRYRLGELDSYRTLRDTLANLATAPWRLWRSRPRRGQERAPDSIWALRDVSFEVKRGEVLGVIGPNGAGKSTLLKILARITAPTEGIAEIEGRVGSLLEVGTGFHQELTGRENIYLSGSILGMKRSEIRRRFDKIVEFAGVSTFLDTPVKRYSSGMYLRLAFSVAAHLEPEVLLVDEILAVGDAAFQKKCLGKMGEVAGSGRTVLFVSHNMAAVRHLCSRGLVLEQGRAGFCGEVDRAVEHYLTRCGASDPASSTPLAERRERSGSGSVRAVGFGARGAGGLALRTSAPAEFVVEYRSRRDAPLGRLFVGISVVDEQGTPLFYCSTGMYFNDFQNVEAHGKVACCIESLPLLPSRYGVNLVLKDDRGIADWVNGAASFEVIDDGSSGIAYMPARSWGHIAVPHRWEWQPAAGQGSGHRRNFREAS